MDLKQAIKNVDDVIAQWSCNREQRRIVETSWQTVLSMVAAPAEPGPKPAKPKPDKEPK